MFDLKRWLASEFRRVATNFLSLDNLALRVSNAAPTRPRDGMVVYADGTDWNPGAGVGFYGYENGAWVKL